MMRAICLRRLSALDFLACLSFVIGPSCSITSTAVLCGCRVQEGPQRPADLYFGSSSSAICARQFAAFEPADSSTVLTAALDAFNAFPDTSRFLKASGVFS